MPCLENSGPNVNLQLASPGQENCLQARDTLLVLRGNLPLASGHSGQ